MNNNNPMTLKQLRNVANSPLTPHFLRKLGFRVKITHRRYYKYLKAGQVITTTPYSYTEALDYFDGYYNCAENIIKEGLQTKGGDTQVSIYKNNELIWETFVECSKKDNFNHHIAIEIAMKRLKKWQEDITKDCLFGFYSATIDNYHGHTVREGINGNKVAVTAIYDDPTCPGYMWPDTIFVGLVKK